MSGKHSIVAELKRRNVLRAGALYIATAWALAQGIAQLAPELGGPEWSTRWFVIASVIGFPFWLAFAWFYEFTPQGLKRESEIDPADSIAHRTGRKLDFMIIGVLAIAVVLLITDRLVLHHGVNETATKESVASPKVPAKSIAVLPFVNMSSDKEQEYFSDGISEELLNLLAQIPQLQVTARTSSFSFKGKDVAIPEIARQLHVAHVLEGSVRKAGNQVRITAQLIDAASGNHLWSRTWDRQLDDIFKIQDEIAAEVVGQLKITLLGAAPEARTTDPAAYALFLQARQLAQQTTAAGYQRSDALYRQVLAIDPRYAPAWVGLSGNFLNKAGQGLMPNQEGYAQAREAALQALVIDPDYAPAHVRLGSVAMSTDNDLAAATRHYERALALDPTHVGVLHGSAKMLQALGRLDEAQALQEAIVRRDPVSASALYELGKTQSMAGRFDAAIANYRTSLNLAPGRALRHYGLGTALLQKGDAPGALAEIEQETNEVWKMIGLPMAYHALGRKPEADAALAALIAKYQQDVAYNVAYVYAFNGEANKAFEWLDKAVEYQDPGLSEIVAENLFDNIRQDPRWLPFLRTLGKAPEQLAKIKFKVSLPDAAAAAGQAQPAARTGKP